VQPIVGGADPQHVTTFRDNLRKALKYLPWVNLRKEFLYHSELKTAACQPFDREVRLANPITFEIP
jgi:hypothetical protein